MGDIKDKKYKGKICSPDAKTLAKKKSTREFCGGKTGLLHDETTVYNSHPDRHWGLATRRWKECARCGKHLSFQYGDDSLVRHSFGSIVRALCMARGMNHSDLAAKTHLPVYVIDEIVANTAALKMDTMIAVADALGMFMNIEFYERDGETRWREGVRLDLVARCEVK